MVTASVARPSCSRAVLAAATPWARGVSVVALGASLGAFPTEGRPVVLAARAGNVPASVEMFETPAERIVSCTVSLLGGQERPNPSMCPCGLVLKVSSAVRGTTRVIFIPDYGQAGG